MIKQDYKNIKIKSNGLTAVGLILKTALILALIVLVTIDLDQIL